MSGWAIPSASSCATPDGDAPVDAVLGLGVFDNNDYDQNEVAVTLFYALTYELRVRAPRRPYRAHLYQTDRREFQRHYRARR